MPHDQVKKKEKTPSVSACVQGTQSIAAALANTSSVFHGEAVGSNVRGFGEASSLGGSFHESSACGSIHGEPLSGRGNFREAETPNTLGF